MRPTAQLTLHAILATALAASAATGASAADAAYLKFEGVDGETTKASSDKPRIAVLEAQGQATQGGKHEGRIQVESWSFGATSSGTHASGGGGGSGKVSVHDISLTKNSDKMVGVEREMKESGEKGGTEDINIGVGELQESKANDRLRTAGPKDGWPAAKPGEAEITLKGAAAPAKSTPPTVTLKRGTSATTTTGGVSVAAGDLDGDGTAAPRKPTIGRATISPKSLPGSGGSLTAVVPAGICKVGARYPAAEFGTGAQVYRMTGVLITGCSPGAASGGSRPTETLSLNFEKIG